LWGDLNGEYSFTFLGSVVSSVGDIFEDIKKLPVFLVVYGIQFLPIEAYHLELREQ